VAFALFGIILAMTMLLLRIARRGANA
jgi:hypothetical protein